MNVSGPIGVVTASVSPEELYQVLSDATSQDPQRIQSSSNRFKELLQQCGALDALHQIAAEKSLPLPIRQQASIQFKNEAQKTWKSRKLQTDQHRANIRARFLTFVNEEDDTIADCIEVSINKVARTDYPDNWPTLIQDLISIINANFQNRYTNGNDDPQSTLVLRRALQFLRGILKEFASIKMLNGIKQMSSLADQLHNVLYTYYFTVAARLPINRLDDLEAPNTSVDLLIAHIIYKSINIVGSWLWQRCDKMSSAESTVVNQWILQLFGESAELLRSLVNWRLIIISSGVLDRSQQAAKPVDLLTRHIKLFGKFFRRLSQLGQRRFSELPPTDTLILFYWDQIIQAANAPPGLIADSNTAPYPVRFIVQGMVLFKETIGQWTPKRRDGSQNVHILSQDFIQNAVRMLVTKFLPLNAKDLRGWMEDPEEWVNVEDKDNDQWEYELRPCSERVLIQISNQFPDFVTPLLQAFFNEIADKPALDVESAVQKEAVYCAIGRCCQKLKDCIPFNQWVQQTLSVEAQDTSPSAPILKRRIAWLLGKWMAEDCAEPNNPLVWQILVHLVGARGNGTDPVVRLTAAVALREGVDTLEFNLDSFAPFLPDAVTHLVTLMGETDTLESKRRVDDALNVVIDRAGFMIASLVDKITGPLPGLWLDAGEDWLFKASLLTTMTNVVKAIGSQSTSLANIVVPLVEESMNEGMNLDSDGVILWKEAMRNTISIQPINGSRSLFDLLPLAIRQLGTNFDLLGSLLEIMESYFLLEGSKILEDWVLPVFEAFLQVFTRPAMRENVKGGLKALSLLVQTTPSNLWGGAMHTSGLFKYLLSTVMEGELDSIILTEEIHLMSRIILADKQMFLKLMEFTAPALSMSEAKTYELLLDQWWDKFDAMSEPRHRKLSAMGVATLVSTGCREVLQRVPTEIFNMWLDVFGEIKESRTDTSSADEEGNILVSPLNLRRHWELDEAPEEYFQGTEGTPEYERRRMVYNSDPIRTLQLSSFVRDRLREAEAICGSQAFQELYLSQADPTVLKQIQDALAAGL